MSICTELPFGLAPDGRLVSVEAVARGLSCECRCSACNGRLVARQGKVNRWHFAHESIGECVGAFETMTHKLAKQIIIEAKQVSVPALVAYLNGSPRRVEVQQHDVTLKSVDAEVWLDGIRPDLLAVASDGMQYAIEILVSHQCSEEKLAILAERQICTLEIDLSGFRYNLASSDIFTNAVLRKGFRQWLWHPRQTEIDAAVQEEERERRAAERAAAEEWRLQREKALEEQRKREAAAALAALRAAEELKRARSPDLGSLMEAAAVTSKRNIAFLSSLSSLMIEAKDMPSCQCWTKTVWWNRESGGWSCWVCEPPENPISETLNAKRAMVPGSRAWNAATRMWEARP